MISSVLILYALLNTGVKMIERIKFGTIDDITKSYMKPISAEEDYLVKLKMAEPDDYVLRFGGGPLERIPALPDFPKVMEICGARCVYVTNPVGDVPIDATRSKATDIKITNGDMFTGNNGRIFQLAYNVVYLASQINIGHELGEFIDVSGTLPIGGNAFHF